MWRSRKHNLKRRMVSGILACLLVATSLTNTVGVISAFAAQGTDAPRVSYKYDDLKNDRGDLDKLVQINVQAENESFLPGSEMVLKVYVQNLSDQYLTGGSLKWNGKGLEEAGFLDEEEEDVFNGPGWDSGDGSGSDTTGGQDGGLMEELGSFGVIGLRKSVALRVDDTNTADGTDGEEGLAPEEKPETIGGMDFTEITEIQDNGEDDSDEPETDDEGKRIKGIELAPGEVYETRFYGTVEDLDSIVTRKVTFEFLAGVDGNDQKLAQDKTEFTYNTGMALVLPVEFEDGPALMTNELNTLYIRTRFEDEKILDEYTWDVTDGDEDEATPADAQRHEITVATMSNGDGDSSEGTTPANMKYSIVTYGAKLLGIEAWRDEDKSDWGEVATGVSFRVADGTEPGVYFGQVTTSIRRDGKSYKTTQGFHFFVLGDGQIVLKGNVNGAEIQVKGDRDHFPEGDMLSLKVTEVPEEKMGLVQEAMAQKADELGVSVDKMMAVDIKVIADGLEQELRGDVEVTFSNLQLQSLDGSLDGNDSAEAAEADGSEEIEEFEEISNHSVFGLRKAAAQQDASAQEEITADDLAAETESQNENGGESNEESSLAVWHFDEDAGAIDEMDSETNDDGDVVMETNHFSIFIVVDKSQIGGDITLIVQHWAEVTTIKGDGSTSNELCGTTDENGPIFGNKSGAYIGLYTKDEVFNREKAEINFIRDNWMPIYKPDRVVLPNKYGQDATGEEDERVYKVNIEELSKVCRVMTSQYTPYEVDQIWISENLDNKDIDIRPTETTSGWEEPYNYYRVLRDSEGNIQKDSTGNPLFVDRNNNEVGEISLEQDKVIRFVYKEREVHEKTYYKDVTFFDHNITNNGQGKSEGSGDKIQYTAGDEGTNSNSNYDRSTGVKIGAGQWWSGNRSSYMKVNGTNNTEKLFNGFRLNGGNAHPDNPSIVVAQKGIVKNQLSDGELVFSNGIAEPGFFKSGKKGTVALNGYELGFIQKGDTYIFSSVKKPGGLPEKTGYEKIEYTGQSFNGRNALYSNEFWPLDDVSYEGVPDATKADGTMVVMDKKAGKDVNDVKGVQHNWHFGMKFQFDFTIGDYIGPMNFYFRGDDDFWMFVDDKLVIDLGGIHSAQGEAVDLKKWLEENKDANAAEVDKENPHHVSIYYMERGGTGSCCYMQFTLPNCNPAKSPENPQISIEVEKQWDDSGNPYRPTKVEATLWQMYEGMEVDKGTVTLDDSNDWKHTWEGLPIHSPNDERKKYTYKVEEKLVPGGYKDTYICSNQNSDTPIELGKIEELEEGKTYSITVKNTLNPVKVKVTKEWDDGDDFCKVRPEEISFRLFEVKNNTLTPYKDKDGNFKDITIKCPEDPGEEWPSEYFVDLPKYNKAGEVITYTVRELDKDGKPIDPNGNLLVEKDKKTYTYDVSYKNGEIPSPAEDYAAHIEVTNKHTHKLTVYKEWSDGNEQHSNENLWVGLYKVIEETDGQGNKTTKEEPSDKPIQLMELENGRLKTKFTDLVPGRYTVRELEECEATEAHFHNLDKTKFYKAIPSGGRYHEIYEVSYDEIPEANRHDCEQSMTIKNQLRKARIRVAKWIDNWEDGMPNDDNKPIEENDLIDRADELGDDFIIEVKQDDTNFETGLVLQHAGDERGNVNIAKISGYIEVDADATGTIYKVKEFVPKEYALSETYGIRYIPNYVSGSDIKENAGQQIQGVDEDGYSSITVSPGDDGLIVIHNTFGHKDYFHHDARVTNLFKHIPARPTSLPDSAPETDTVSLAALPPEVTTGEETEKIDDKRLL